MANNTHVEWLREGVVRWNKRRKRVSFSPDLSGVSFFELLPPDFRDDPKTSRTFEKIDLSRADLERADLSHLNFRRSRFEDANMRGADLSLSRFDDAKFVRADLTGANISNSSFVGTVFDHAVIDEVKLEDADFSGASFIDAGMPIKDRVLLEGQGASIYKSIQAHKVAIRTKGAHARTNDNNRDSKYVAKSYSLSESERTVKIKYDVFFGTTREPEIERGAVVSFNENMTSQLSFGLCEVIVPESHRIGGSLGSPLWKRLLNKKVDRKRIESLITLDRELFFKHLTDSDNRMAIQQVPTIFVHGFNTTFDAAVLRAAQIGFDLGIGQGVGLFSWPSKGKRGAYSADEAAAEASKYLLAEFIEAFIKIGPTSHVNLIAHSMGCRCLLGALEVLSDGKKSVLRNVNQVILAAADVDAAIMPSLGVAATRYATRTTSYVSGKDKALMLSGWLHDFPRVGFVPPTFVMGGMDTVLVNDDDLGTMSHGYVGSSRVVLGDIFELLSKNNEPSKRFALLADARGYWQIKN